MLSSNDIRKKFLDFFVARGHVVQPSSSLIPEGDSSVLFTTAGMQQFKPYYTGDRNAEKDFGSKNVVTIQKCVRTGDIDEVGDNTHLTFFEMLGNFSFGGYGRREAITYAHDFITQELGLQISYVTFYKGIDNVPRDDESRSIWEDLNVSDIREDGADVFWGPTGNSGPCGPTTEIYCKNAAGEDVEIWNIVFNEYFCNGSREQLDKGEAKLEKLPTLGIDTGMGFERLLAIVQKTESVFETDVFVPIMDAIKNIAGSTYDERSARIIADHIRSASVMIADGVRPDNKDAGYILRRLIRRATVRAQKMKFFEQPGITTDKQDGWGPEIFLDLLNEIFKIYEKPGYFKADVEPTSEPEVDAMMQIAFEVKKFVKTLNAGLKEFSKGIDPFILATTYGFPIELTQELAIEQGIIIDREKFDAEMKTHQDLSRSGAEQKFKGGLGGDSEKIVRSHTAHHLLLAALRKVLGDHVHQRGSNITDERIRIDFAHDTKMTDEQKSEVEKLVNEWIAQDLPMQHVEMKREDAEKIGAEMEFGVKYPDTVSVYFIGSDLDHAVSREFCGGPHIDHTGLIGTFKIQKEEASSAGVRRIKATIE